jgi:hypothetical protein
VLDLMRTRYVLGAILDVPDELDDDERAAIEERVLAAFPEARLATCSRMGWSSTDDEPAERPRLRVIRE